MTNDCNIKAEATEKGQLNGCYDTAIPKSSISIKKPSKHKKETSVLKTVDFIELNFQLLVEMLETVDFRGLYYYISAD